MNATERARISDAYYSGTTTKREVCDAAALLREENENLRAENDRLREVGERLFDKTLELGTENAKLRDALKALMVGTYAELCSDRDAPQCRKCSMRRDERECAITEAMELLGLHTDGTPVGVEVDG